jgi:hypothetical protein
MCLVMSIYCRRLRTSETESNVYLLGAYCYDLRILTLLYETQKEPFKMDAGMLLYYNLSGRSNIGVMFSNNAFLGALNCLRVDCNSSECTNAPGDADGYRKFCKMAAPTFSSMLINVALCMVKFVTIDYPPVRLRSSNQENTVNS